MGAICGDEMQTVYSGHGQPHLVDQHPPDLLDQRQQLSTTYTACIQHYGDHEQSDGSISLVGFVDRLVPSQDNFAVGVVCCLKCSICGRS